MVPVDGEILDPQSRIPEYLAGSDDGRCTEGVILYDWEYIGHDYDVGDCGDGECDLCSEKEILNVCWTHEQRRNVVGRNNVSVVARRALHRVRGNMNCRSRALLRDLIHYCTALGFRSIEEPTVKTTRSCGYRDKTLT
jgi:hypothetical protein